MKTAEEWVKIDAFQYDKTPNDVILINVIKQIQQDALKQGYIDACLQMSLECEKMKGMKNEIS